MLMIKQMQVSMFSFSGKLYFIKTIAGYLKITIEPTYDAKMWSNVLTI